MILAQLGSALQQTQQQQSFVSPRIGYWSSAPITIFLVGALVLLLATSLMRSRRLSPGIWTVIGVSLGALSLISSMRVWSDIRAGQAPTSNIEGALIIDGFSVFFFALIAILVMLSSLVAEPYLLKRNLERREFYLLMFLAAAGAMCMAAAGDMIVLFIGLEILSIALYVMTGYHRDRSTSREAALKYFLLGALASAIFVYGIAMLYGATGTTNLTEMTSFLSNVAVLKSGVLVAGILLVLIGLAFKVSLVPFHMWTPDVYQGAVTPATGYMAAIAKIGGFAALLRIFGVVLSTRQLDWQPVMWVLAVASLIVGPILAVKQTSVKRLLAYSSITHAGFILLGLETGTIRGIESAMFYLLSYSFIVIGSFAVISVVTPVGDDSIDRFRGLSSRRPGLAAIFAVLLMAQTGVPLTSGFFAKVGVIGAAVEAKAYPLAIIAMLASVVAAFAYLRVIVRMYMAPADGEEAVEVSSAVAVALGFAVGITIILGVIPESMLIIIHHATLAF